MAANDDVLTPRQRKAITALCAAKSITSAAKDAGVSESQLHRWLRQEDFRRELDTAQAQLIDGLSRQLATLAGGAMVALADGLQRSEPTMVRLKAADSILKHLLSIRELATLEARLTELESAVALDLAQARAFAEASIERGEAKRIDYRLALQATDPR